MFDGEMNDSLTSKWAGTAGWWCRQRGDHLKPPWHHTRLRTDCTSSAVRARKDCICRWQWQR